MDIMKKKIFSIITLLCLAMTSAWAQNAASADCAENSPNASRQETKVVNSRRAASAEYGNVAKTFNCTSGYQYGIATDGTYIYTSGWSVSIDDGYLFHQYDIDGNLIDAFNISGVTSGIRDMTYDGTYFYGATCSNTVYQMDFANKSLVGTFNIPKKVRAITYDSTNDGFWATGNWDKTLDLYDRSGNLIKNGESCGSVSGCAYCVDNDGQEHVLMCNNGNNQVYDYNITTNTLSEPTLNLSTMPNFSGGSTGGCFIGNYNGKVSFFADLQQGPQLIGIYELTNILGSKGLYALSTGISEHGTLTFKVDNKEVTSANAGDVVTVVVKSDKGWLATAAKVAPRADWGDAKAPRRAQINIMQPFDADATDAPEVFTFTMPEANVDLLITYDHKPLADAMIAALDDVTYNGSAFTPLPVVKDGSYDLVKDVDYTVSYSNNVNAGTATVTITAKGKDARDYFYTGTASKNFTIKSYALQDYYIAKIDDVTYTGVAHRPVPVVTWDGVTLENGKDYMVGYSHNVNAGTATVIVAGMGNFTATASKDFKINKAALTVKADDKNVVYGDDVPEYTVSYEGFVNNETKSVLGGKLDFSCAYVKNFSTAGEFVIIPSGLTADNYNISFVKGKLTVGKKALTSSLIADIAAMGYTGAAQTPAVVVKDGETTLVEGTDYTVAYANNVNVGTATVTITAVADSKKYTGSASKNFVIGSKVLKDEFLSDIDELTYTGEALTPAVIIKDGNTALVQNIDYTLTYANNVNAGTATVTATGKGNYGGTASKNFVINPVALTAATLVETNLVFNLQEQEVEVASVTAGTLVVPEEGYEVSGNKATNVGNYTAIITGKGNFKGEVTAQWSIVADDANTFALTLDPTEFVYDGQEKKPAVTVKDGETTLVENTDYTLAYANNVNAGTATVTATGKGNYSGTKTAEFIIKKAEVVMTAPTAVSELVYTAQAQTLIAAGQAEGGEMQYSLDGEDFSTALPAGIDAKEYSVFFKVVGDQNHNDTEAQQVKVTIAQAALTAVTLAETNFVYNQQEQTAEVASVSAGTLVVLEDSYEVSGNKATNVGTYTATITGKGNFKGEVTAQWSIVADDANTFVLTLNPTEFVYDGTEKTPAVTVKDGETTLVENTDYTLAYANNVNAGTATVTATGMGNYSGTKTAEFIIKKAEVVMTAPTAVSELVYTAQAQTLIAAGQAEGGEMQYSLDGEDFSTALPAGIDAKEYSVFFKVVGDQNHNDTEAQQVKVTIAQAALTAVTLAETNFVYNQQEQTAEVASVSAGTLVVLEDSYEVSGNKATNVGTYTATITGKGNFKGEVTAQWSIVADDANTFVLTLNPTEFVYDGTEKTPAVTVKDGETTLVENTDYTLAYANNVNAGTATVTATGMGNYSGTKTAEFIIKKAEVVMTAPEVVTGLVYTAQAQTLIAVGSAEGGEMQYSLDGDNFSTTLPAGTDAKEYSVFFKVVGDQNHNDTEAQQLKVTIEQAVLTAFELSPVKFVYNKQEQVAQVSGVKAGELVVTEEGYEVSGNKATEVGTYTVTVTGKGNFKGELKGQFTIVADKAALDNAIAEANDYYATIAEDYADIAAVLMEAINAAKGVKADEAATQQAVDDAVAALQAALQAAKDAVNDILSAIETAQTKSNDQWYDMKGRKLEGTPTKKGVYVLNGRKVVIK